MRENSLAETLPHLDRLEINQSKLTEYLLSEANSHGKAAFFRSLGYEQSTWKLLAEALRIQARTGRVVSIVESPYGTRYSVDGEIGALVYREFNARVRTVWILEPQSTKPRLITAHPV